LSLQKIKTGIFGGSFDPVHKGHVTLVRTLKEQEKLDKVVILPAFVSPWKLDQLPASAEDRIAMLRLAFKDESYVEISDFETKQEKSCYTYDTLMELQKLHPTWEIYFITGKDQADNLKKWYRGDDLLKQYHFLWTERFYDVSSTQIRENIRHKLTPARFLPDGVWDYIRVHGLYTETDGTFYQELDRFVKDREKPSRYAHTQGVVKMARQLALRYGEDPKRAEIAAIFHDAFREKGNLQHGAAAADYLQQVYGLNDQQILDAIRWHTTGRPGMCLLEKILKIADSLEEGRVYPGVEELRSSISDDVDKTLLMLMKHTREFVLSIGEHYSEISNLAIDELERKMNEQ